MADHFQQEFRLWSFPLGYGVVGEPELNGAIERPSQILNEQIVHARVFQTIDDVRDRGPRSRSPLQY